MNPRDGVELMETQSCGLKGELDGETKASDGKEAEMDDDKTPGAYDCNICGRSFPFLSSLSQHMRRHTGARPYKCPYCDHRASQKGNLKVHIRSHKLGTLSSHHSNDDDEGGAEEEEEAASAAAEVGVSEGLDGGTSPTKSSSACNRVVSGGDNNNAAEEGKRKPPARNIKREKPTSDQRPFCCRLCGYEAQREDQLLSHIEKVHITADTEEESCSVKEEAVTEAEPVQQPQTDGTFPCETCGQVFTQAWFLKSHMKKHAGILEHCCHICGRRFREAWFLKSHMKTHNTKSKSRTKVENSEPAVTINDVAQDPDVSASSVTSVYQICSKCGNLFHSRESLRAHEKVHGNGARRPQSQRRPSDDEDSPAAKRRLLDYLNLGSAEGKSEEDGEEEKEKNSLGHRIPELDPVCSYQAWQLATRGRVVEPIEPSYKASSGEGSMGPEALAGAAVVYEKESSRYVLKGQERRSSGRRSSSHASSGDRTPESLSDSEYRPASRQDRRRPSQTSQTSSSKSNECFECGKVFRSRHQMMVHQRVHRKEKEGSGGEKERGAGRGDRWGSTSDPESGSPSRPSTPGYGDSPPASALGNGEASEMDTADAGQLAADEKPYVCSLCDFVATESSAYLSHVRVQHPATQDGSRPSPAPSPSPSSSSSSDRGNPSGYPKLKMALLQGLPTPVAAPPHPYLSPRSSVDKPPPGQSSPSSDPNLTPLDLCVKAEVHRGPSPVALDLKKGLPSHKCSFCSYSSRYPEVLWMHQTVSHRINSSSSSLAPKWALKNGLKRPRDGSSYARRRTGPPPVLEGKECPPLPPVVRTPRTQPPAYSGETPKKSNKPAAGHPSNSSSSSSTPSSRGCSSSSGSQAARHAVRPGSSSSSGGGGGGGSRPLGDHPSHSRPKVDLYPRGGSSSSSLAGSLEKSTGSISSQQRPSAPPPASSGSASGGARLADQRYMMPQEGLGFMLSSKHGLAEYSRARSSPQPSRMPHQHHHHHQPHHQPHANNSHGQAARAAGLSSSRPSTITHSSSVGHGGYGTSSQAQHGGHALQNSTSSLSSGGVRGDVKQEAMAEAHHEMPMDVLSFLKNYSPHELAALYHRWGAANALLDPTGMLRSLMRQGQYVCHECGKSFSQPSHLRTHMRSHTVGFDFNGLHRGTDAHTTATEAPKQGRDHSAAASARTEPLRKGT